MALTKISLVLFLCLLGFYSQTVKSQNCSCAPNFCCSQHGYCGTTDEYCGNGCRSGPCGGSGTPSTGGGSVGSIVTQGFCYREEISTEKYCSKSKKYPCEPGKNYYGRGLLQSITWNEYYGAAGKHLGLPLLKDPDLVARSPEVAFKFAMWFWNRNVRPALYLGFGEVTKRVDGRECSNWRRDGTRNKVKQYIEFCKMLGVTPDQGLDC